MQAGILLNRATASMPVVYAVMDIQWTSEEPMSGFTPPGIQFHYVCLYEGEIPL
jgi:hypothetical protein